MSRTGALRVLALAIGPLVLLAVGCSSGGATAGAARRAATAGAARQAAPDGIWGLARPVPGYAALPHSGGSPVVGLSCAAPGNCTASGFYWGPASESEYPFAFSEVHGAWGRARLIPGLAALETSPRAFLGDPSCAEPGDCAAVGNTDKSAVGAPTVVGHVFAVSQVDGVWRRARSLPGFASSRAGQLTGLNGLSCAAPGDCTAVGFYAAQGTRVLHAAVASQVGGRWRRPQALPGIVSEGPSAPLESVSCTAPGDCEAGWSDWRQHEITHPIVVSQAHGTWARPEQVAGVPLPAVVDAVTCPGPGSCTVVVSGARGLYVASMASGRWGAARPVPGLAALSRHGVPDFGALACASPGNCAMGGSYPLARTPAGYAGPTGAFVVAEVNGTWGEAIEVPGTAVLNTGRLAGITGVSCAPRGPCTVAGYYWDRRDRAAAYFLSETGGVWGRLQQVRGVAPLTAGSSRILSLSCPRAGRCGAVGLYTTTLGYHLFVVDQRP